MDQLSKNVRVKQSHNAVHRQPHGHMSTAQLPALKRMHNRNVGASHARSQSHTKQREGQQGKVQKKAYFFTAERTVTILEKISALCIFMLFFGLPLFFLNLTYQGVGFEKQYYFYFWTFLGVVAVIARGMLRGKMEIRRTPLDTPLAILWVVFLISLLFSVDKYHSFFGFFGNPVNGFMSVTAAILAYYLIVSYISHKRIYMIWWSIVCSGSIVVIWSFLATMRFVPMSVLEHITPSLTGSFTSLAVFLGMLLPVYIISFSLIDQQGKNTIKNLLVTVVLFVVMIVDVFTLSVLYGYVQWYVILIAMLLLPVFTISRTVTVSSKTSSMALFVFFGLFILWMWGQPIVSVKPIQSETSINYSLSFHVAKEALKNRPFFGSGPGTYGYNFSLYRPKSLNKNGQYDVRFYSDRGVFMESLSTVGLVGMIALVIVVLTYGSTVVLSFLRTHDNVVKNISLGLFVSSVVALMYGMFWAVDGMIILYGVLIGALAVGFLRCGSHDSDQKITLSLTASPQHALSFAFLSILLAIGVIIGFVTLSKMFVADIHAGNALKARAADRFLESSELFRKAVVLNDKEGRYFIVIGQYGLDLANMERAKSEGERSEKAISQYISGATGAATSGKDRMPNDVLANEIKGFVYENSGNYASGAFESAVSAYERAHALEPLNPYLDVALGKLKLVEARVKGEESAEEKTALVNAAKAYFDAAKEKTTFQYNGREMSLFAAAHYYISVVEEALGNTDEAITAMADALQVAQSTDDDQALSRQVNYGFNLARLLQIRGTDEDIANAEKLLLQIIRVNDQEVNSHLSLGLLYEKQGKNDEAIAEYEKILTILPEDDTQARDNITSLIDTVKQGGNNFDGDKKAAEDEKVSEKEEGKDTVVEKEPVNMIIIQRGDVRDRAQEGRDALSQKGFDAEIREESDAEFSGVTVFYGAESNRANRENIVDTLKEKFGDVTVERNDEEVNTYNHDVVVIIGA